MDKDWLRLVLGTLLVFSGEIFVVLQLNTLGAIALLGYTGGLIILVKLMEKHGHTP